MGYQHVERVIPVTQFTRVFLAFFLCTFTLTFLPVLAIAQVTAQTVDMRPVAASALEWVATALGTALTVLAGFAVRFVSSKIGVANTELEASLAARLNDIIHRAIDFAYMTALNEVNKPGSGLAAVKFDNWFMSMAASYVNSSAPEIIKKFGLSQARIEELIIARLPAYAASVPVSGGLATPVRATSAAQANAPSAG